MIEKIRQKFNDNYTDEKYSNFIESCNQDANFKIPFRIAETPIFGDKKLYNKVIKAGEEILSQVEQVINNVDLDSKIPDNKKVEGIEGEMSVVCLDYAIVKNNQELNIQLIELQGFPSLFAFQNYLGKKYTDFWGLDENLTYLMDGLDFDSYNKIIAEFIIGNHDKENVILLEIDPWNQGTSVDFLYSEKYFGIKTVCLSEIKKKNNKLYYEKDNKLIEIKRIYNRIILDELEKRNDFIKEFGFYEEVDVEWVCHPNWFQKCSKLMIPYLKSDYIPETYFLNEINTDEINLDEWVLKPIFSFSGQGVIFNIQKSDIDNINDKSNYIIQRKIKYEPIVKDINNEYSKIELRVMYIKKDGKFLPVTNLGRMTKGDLIGVKYNKDKIWVGSNIFLFER